jgi:hypothetical protein
VWSEGVLRVPGHQDAEAERTLAALGGDVPECIRIREAWETWSGDPALITLGRRPGEAALGFAADDGLPVAAALHTPPLRRRPPEPVRREALVELLSLPLALVDRLVLTSMAAAAEAWTDEAFRERHGLRLGASLAARARPSFERLGRSLAAPGEDVVVHIAPAPPGLPVDVRAARTARGVEVTATLPLAWLASVWGAGLSEPDGHVVVALRGEAAGGYEVDVVAFAADGAGRWRGEVAPAVVVRGPTGDWRVEPPRR